MGILSRFGFSRARAAAVGSILIVGVVLGPTSPAVAKPPVTHSSELDAPLAKLVTDGIPGAIAIARVDGHWQTASAGVANLETGQPIRPADHFRIGSETKVFISTVILKLEAEGKLSLNDSVEHWLPGLVPNGSNITIKELLNHTSGLYDYIQLPFYIQFLHHPFETFTPEQLVADAVSQPPLFPPGTQWAYSNTDYILLGMIIARVDHAPQALEMTDPAAEVYARILIPLGLRNTRFPIFNPFLPRPFAHGYEIGAPAGWNLPPVVDTTFENPSWAWTAGAMTSNLSDVLRFQRALFSGKLLPAVQQAELETTVPVQPGLNYGLGVFETQTPCGPAWGHTGAVPSAAVVSYTSPDGSRQAAVMVNQDENTWSYQESVDFFAAAFTAFCGQAPTSGTVQGQTKAAHDLFHDR